MMERALLVAYFTLVSCLAYSSTLNMEASCSSEMSVEFQRTNGVVSQKTDNHRCENAESYTDVE
jgi:hypothetical protein